MPRHSHNDGVPCSNQGVATIFGRREHTDRRVEIFCEPLTEAFVLLAVSLKIPSCARRTHSAPKYQINHHNQLCCTTGLPHWVFREALAYRPVLLPLSRKDPPCAPAAHEAQNIKSDTIIISATRLCCHRTYLPNFKITRASGVTNQEIPVIDSKSGSPSANQNLANSR